MLKFEKSWFQQMDKYGETTNKYAAASEKSAEPSRPFQNSSTVRLNGFRGAVAPRGFDPNSTAPRSYPQRGSTRKQ